MSEEIDYFYETLLRAHERLCEAAAIADDQLEKDGTIQRFEFTFELLWKLLKKILERQGLELHTPREVLSESFRIGIIDDDSMALEMLNDRNITSHVYDEGTAGEIFARIKENYVPGIRAILEKARGYL